MNLKKLETSHIEYLKNYFKDVNPELSPYSLSEIFLWNGCLYDVYIIEYTKGPIIVEIPSQNHEKKRILFPFPQNSKPDYSPLEIKEILNNINSKIVYYVPFKYIQSNPDLENYFEVYEQTDYQDYIYNSKLLAELSGSKYSSKRNLIKQFENLYSSLYSVTEFSHLSLNDIINLWNHTERQISSTDENMKILECEKKAIENIFKYLNLIDLFGVCLYINNEIKAFAIGSHLNKTTCILNFEKADKNIKGLYQFIDREFAKLVANKYQYINKESDLGKESLKKAKLSYYPLKIIKSYMLVLK